MKQVEGIWLPDSDTHFEAHLRAGQPFEGKGTYQFHKIQLAIAATPETRRGLAIDVGAHVGLWSRVLARTFFQLEAFEPVPYLRECWNANLAGYENTQLHPFAVSNESGEIDLHVVEANSGNCRVHCDDDGEDVWTLDKTTAVALDDWPFDRRLDLLKVDVEGWELRVVQGAERAIKHDRPVVVVEQKPGHAERYGMGRRDAVDLLEAWGMSVAWEKAGDVCMRWK
jgi:FkbM family methyltransferase